MEKIKYLLDSCKIKEGQEAPETAERRKQEGSRQKKASHSQQLRAMFENFKYF